jgi:lipoprotein-releasing system ATP-binding protein
MMTFNISDSSMHESIASDSSVVLEARNLSKTYIGGDGNPLHVLQSVNLTVKRGEMVAIVGESGSGKSTMLHLLGALDRPTEGDIFLNGRSLTGCSDAELAEARNRNVGFVFQFHHLLREFSALENVSLPLRISGLSVREADSRARELLDRVGLSGRLHHRPGELSGGEQQRTAVARALATRPGVVLADEPSGNLDQANGERLHDLLAEVVRDLGVAMVVVTHNPSLAERATVVYKLERGQLINV